MNPLAVMNHLATLLDTHLRVSGEVSLPPAPLSGEALLAGALAMQGGRAVVWITHHPDDIEQGIRNLHTLAPALDAGVLPFPPAFAASSGPRANAIEDPDLAGRRMRTLFRLSEIPADGVALVITSATALLQETLSPATLANRTVTIEPGAHLPPDVLAARLQAHGYRFESEVLDKGQAARRGGILDVWPPDRPWPLRIEWFGDTIESLRAFDSGNQRKVESLDWAILPPAVEHIAPGKHASRPSHLLDHVRMPITILWSDRAAIREHMKTLASGGPAHPPRIENMIEILQRREGAFHVDIGGGAPAAEAGPWPVPTPLPHAVALPASAGIAPLTAARNQLLDDLSVRSRRNHDLWFFFDTDGTREHFRRHLAGERLKHAAAHFELGRLSEGFCIDALSLTVVAESDVYGRRKTNRGFEHMKAAPGRAGRYAGSRIQDFTDMSPGDLVVHVEHGVGRYRGVETLLFNGSLQEVLALDYAEGGRLYVPVTHAHLLSRYVGMSGRTATLHRLGGNRWAREKGAAQVAVRDLAAELLEVQARRNLLQGHAFAPDTPLQHEFENAFAFEETDDQRRVIEEVRADMESSRPMDRLICGDAGYGKTEVAMRAAFKTFQDGFQVAVLVPTTVLAQQHMQTFSERMSGFDVRIAMISRFQSPARRREILTALARGDLDIIIGTHALVQPGVGFARLGLVIIDEEQRFGVAHKERLKRVKQLVDVLTLSATPIPRTLYLSMTGARDMSLLRTPPRERVPIETLMAPRSDAVIRDAIQRELARGGQVYVLHNRVASIERFHQQLAALVPEARMETAHGQMKSSELSAVMRRFAAGETDVLICTTIIESGVDIPRANTILIDRADRFGIADLYQLRGRVGRSDRKAYALLLLPPHGQVDADARERIQSVRRHAGLGAGFNLAVRDMEIRGAGNILGTAQSGHISAVGFGLYCRLLQNAVARLKGDPAAAPVTVELRLDFIRTVPDGSDDASAALPHTYIPDERLRVAIYRRLSEASSPDAVGDLALEVADRFGPPPPPVRRLLAISRLRHDAAARGIDQIEVRNRKIMARRNGEFLMENGRFPRLRAETPDQALAELREFISVIPRT